MAFHLSFDFTRNIVSKASMEVFRVETWVSFSNLKRCLIIFTFSIKYQELKLSELFFELRFRVRHIRATPNQNNSRYLSWNAYNKFRWLWQKYYFTSKNLQPSFFPKTSWPCSLLLQSKNNQCRHTCKLSVEIRSVAIAIFIFFS